MMRRIYTILSLLLLSLPMRLFAVGWTPTDAGLVVNMEQGDRFLLSVWVDKNGNGKEEDGEEFFVSNYNRYSGGYYNYTAGPFMKLLPVTEVTEMNEWSVGAPLARSNKALGGIAYTIWNDGKTLKTSDTFKFLGELTDNYADAKACDVVFVIPIEHGGVPTVQGRPGLSSFDPNGTLGRGKTPFSGAMGTGFLGMTYREVYMFDIPKANSPQSYTNAALVTFNTSLSTWKLSSGAGDIAKGKAAYAYADSKHDKTPRTIFRLYLLDNPMNSCSSYFFATDEQDYKRYRMNENNPQKSTDSTAAKKIYTMDRLTCMTHMGSTKYYQTDLMRVPEPDSTYYYVGYNNAYKDDTGESMGTNGAKSRFTKIRELPIFGLPSTFKAPAGAIGRMVADTTSAEYNLDVRFDPAGYFLKVSTGKNVRMRKTGENEWTTQDMWTIDKSWEGHTIRATLMTGPEFSDEDPGVDIAGWSKDTLGSKVPVKNHPEWTPAGQSGYARIYTNRTDANGAMEFILAETDKHIHYDNNGFLGVEIPNQYPLEGETTIIVQAPRLKAGYVFDGWNTRSDGSGDTIRADSVLTLDKITWTGDTVFNLYALAHYDGTLQVAISFMQGDKRYYLTHPSSQAPRYARARHFEDWENTWQGMENAENLDPNYISTFEMRFPIDEINHKECDTLSDLRIREKVLDPRRYVMRGYEDSLIFYEHFAPARDEYLGLYYTTPNTILANNTWAGLFETTSKATPTGWPDYQVPYIPSTKLKSIRYVEEYDATKPDSLVLKQRSNSDKPWVHYNESDNQFDGVASEGDATEFEISAVIVADAHYIIVPDTSEGWRDTIEFAYHQNEPIAAPVWSQLIGKQLLACMMVGRGDKIDTVYFHPNLKKEIRDPNNLYLSPDYRVSMVFDLIRDSRVAAPLPEGDSVQHETTDYHWHNEIVSGINSPMKVKDAEGNYIDIVDTFRITLSHGGISKIKEYRGIWNARDAHVKASADGLSRYRDVIVRTKTYHYGDTTTQLVLRPQYDTYSFSPLAGMEKQINFTLVRETSRSLLDKDNNPVSTVVIKRDTITSQLALGPGMCTLKGSAFDIVRGETTSGDHVTLITREENTEGVNYDTLTVTTTVNDTVIVAKVPLMQAALTSNELLWSVVDGNKRYFIMPKRVGETYSFVFRQYRVNNSIMYKENSSTHLVKGSKDAANSDSKYITPWEYKYKSGDKTQLTLKAVLTSAVGDTARFAVRGGAPAAHPTDSAFLTYKIVTTYTNDNANYEERVKLRYGDPGTGKWLKFTGGATPSLSLVEAEGEATVFSWSYMVQEYNLLNNGTYPSRDFVEFGYNERTEVAVQTLYKAYKEYSTLLSGSVTYLCRQEEKNVETLRNPAGEWLTDMTISLIRDSRFGVDKDSTKLAAATDYPTLTTTVSTDAMSPLGTRYPADGPYVNIVDTLDVRLSLQPEAPAYRFKGDWKGFKSVDDAHLKLPLIRRTYHLASFDSLYAGVADDQYSYTFPATITKGTNDSCVFSISTLNRTGSHMLNVENEPVRSSGTTVDVTDLMNLSDKNLAEVRLADEYGNTPDWCHIRRKTKNTIVIECTANGIRSPRTAYLYLAYIVMLDPDGEGGDDPVMRFVNYRLTVAQASSFEYANNQRLIHTGGASGDEPMDNGMQQVHTNKRILYYYPDQDVELPVRERGFYGWWRWYREGKDVNEVDVSDTDVPDSLWRVAPRNEGKYIFPFHIIGDSVPDPERAGKKKLVTMGRFSVFHYRSKDYGNKQDPPSKNPRVAPPTTEFGGAKPVLTYAVDISNYYDNLPMSLKDKNQVDIAMLDTTLTITEPTLSLREIFELRPWTEMAERMEDYKDPIATPCTNLAYMEDHTVMAPIGNRLLLQTEQRYNLEHLNKRGLSESLLGYYMRDDNWSTGGWSDERKDTMIWCGGWDADCLWYTYNPKEPDAAKRYSPCEHPVTEEDDFLQVPAKTTLSTGREFDTVYYCLRARSNRTEPDIEGKDSTVDGDYMFNICRYRIIYHNPKQYGPLVESKTNGVAKAIITNDEIEQRYDVLERLDFDYIKPGKDYHIYPHPLPWGDASYGYTYPETPDLPHNRYHDESDFPNHGEYGLINRIPYSAYWHKMEQHGGAENGYMIYCDGMSSSGQVAALTLSTNLCAGQKMFFSAYVGNPSSQKGKSNPNFIFSVQGKTDKEGAQWEDITSYMTGDIQPSNQWYQIYFPIIHTKNAKEEYSHFRVRIYNVSNSFDGNDFIIDDMCIFATKPPLIAYQANTVCKRYGEANADTHILLRLDYKGITGEGYHGKKVFYTVEQMTPDSVYSFVTLKDGYLEEDTAKAVDPAAPDTLYGKIYIPELDYEPQDSIFHNMNELIKRFNDTDGAFKEGYIYEILEGVVRPVKYIVHTASMDPANDYTVHMSGELYELMSSLCGMTSHLKISNRMVLELNGEEQPEVETFGLCANSTYDISLRVRGSLYLDSVAPIDVTGSCVNDWLLYGDTAHDSSLERYGYCYDDIVKVVKDILRYMPMDESSANTNQFAPNLTSVSREEMTRIKKEEAVTLETSDHPYDVLTSLVNNGFLKLYKRNMTVTVTTGDSVEYVILPIIGTGSKEVTEANVEVCPNPIYLKLKPERESGLPLIVGGLHRDSTQMAEPVEVLAGASTANSSFKLRVDSIMPQVGIYSIELRTTDDPGYIPGVHTLRLEPDRAYPSGSYYVKGDSITLRPSAANNYMMKAGYHYTFNIVMQTIFGKLRLENGCEVGVVPFILSIVPDYLRWDPKSPENNNWNEAENWVAIDENNVITDSAAHFVPMSHTSVLIPKMEGSLPYPVLPALPLPYKDSVQKVNFQYNTCNAIRFLPEAAMAQQQHMNYTDAVADMSMPYNKWAFRGAPVKGMISGDLFRANADLNNETPLWEVGEFDANGRNYTTGNATFWLSLYSRTTLRKGNGTETKDTVRNASADWSRVTNGLSLPMPAGMGWSVYARSNVPDETSVVRLPKQDDKYYYYNKSGEKMFDLYEQNLQALRTTVAGGSGAGQLAFHADYEEYTIANDNSVTTTSFVFGNPSMGYIDIWGFVADNCLKQEIDYIDPSGTHRTVSRAYAESNVSEDVISNQMRYLPPMHAMVVKLRDGEAAVNSKTLVLNSYRVLTEVSQKEPAIYACGVSGGDQGLAQAPQRSSITNHQSSINQGIMTVTAINPVSPRCNSRLVLGQGYRRAVVEGEDAVLTTVNIDNFHMTNTPTTPFNIYAMEDGYGLSIDLRDSIVNIPIAFYMSALPYDPTTQLWFTGVNNIHGALVLYDALTDTERPIYDGICLSIETPEANHERRYYIRRRGFKPGENIDPDDPIATGWENQSNGEQVIKIIRNGLVYILRGDHVYTLLGQQVR